MVGISLKLQEFLKGIALHFYQTYLGRLTSVIHPKSVSIVVWVVLKLNAPFNRCVTNGYCPTGIPLIGRWVEAS